MRPGMTYAPVASMVSAPGGAPSSPRGAIALIRLPSMRMACPSSGRSWTPSMIVAPEMRSGGELIGVAPLRVSAAYGREDAEEVLAKYAADLLVGVAARHQPAGDVQQVPWIAIA